MRKLYWKGILGPVFVGITLIFFTSPIRSLTVGKLSQNATVEDVRNVSLSLPEVGRGENSEVLRSSNGTDRHSRQLWSLIHNVVDKYKTENNNGNNNNKPALGAALGTLASSFIGNLISSGINSNLGSSSSSVSIANPNQFHQHPYHDHVSEPQSPPPPPTNPNDYMHYLLLNSQANQHASVPHYQKQQYEQSTSDLIEKYKEQMASSASTLGNHGDSTASSSNIATTGSQLLSKLALGSMLDDGGLEKFSNFLSFGSFERMMEKVNKFDKLKCIPRLLCQMVAKREEDSRLEESTSTTTRRPAKRRKSDDNDDVDDEHKKVEDVVPPVKEGKKEELDDDEKEEDDQEKSQTKNEKKNPNSKQDREEESSEDDTDNDEEEDDDDDEAEDDDSEEKEYTVIKGGSQIPKQEGRRSGRIFKINGADAALEQFVKFLDLMQLKDWSIYPYVNGAYQGHQVERTEDCAYKFPSCPFSDDQLVYYFNNYNGGFFQSI